MMRGYLSKLFRLDIPDGKIRQEAYQEITRSLNRAFALPSLMSYASTLSTQGLLAKSVQMFVGSRAIPKNIELSRHLLRVAESRAADSKQKDEIEYYKYFFLRIDAFTTGKTEQFDMTTEVLNKLAEQKGHPQSCYLAGKQIFNVATNTREQNKRSEMFKLATFYFQKSLKDGNYGGLYYIGEVLRMDYSSIPDKESREFFIFGAAMGDPLCYFRLAHLYLADGSQKLYLKYLKLAAEAGVIEAQHNLGCEYLQGKKLKKDQIKALSWFMHAGANGYIQSKFNVALLFIQGSSCGRIKRNPKVALLKLEELKSLGEEVEEKIKEILSSKEIQQLLKQENGDTS